MARRRNSDFSDNVMAMAPAIRDLSVDEMNAVYSLLKDRHGRIQIDASENFHVGQSVEFTGRRGNVITGIIERINRKTIALTNCSDSVSWRVSPSILRLV